MDIQGFIDWGVSIETAVIDYLTKQIGIPFYLIKLFAIFAIVLWICILIWQFSGQLARKNLFTLDIGKYKDRAPTGIQKAYGIVLYALKYLVLFPIYTIVWGGIFVFFLTFMVSEANYKNVVFFSTIVIAIIRTIAYFNEGYAKELAKALPLWLLVSVMLDPQLLSKVALTLNIAQLLQDNTVYMSIGFIVAIEWAMRAFSGVRDVQQKNAES